MILHIHRFSPVGVHLVSVANNFEGTGTVLYIVGEEDGDEYFSKKLQTGQLSPACGDRYERCKKLAVDKQVFASSLQDTIVQLILFVPVEGGLVPVDVRADPNKTTVPDTDRIPTDSCNPAALYETKPHQFQMACIETLDSSDTLKILFYDIEFDSEDVSQTRLRKISSKSFASASLSQVSNFEYVNHDGSQYVLFTTSDRLNVFDPFLDYYDSAKLANCTAAYQVEHVRNAILAITCYSGSVVYFDLIQWTVINQTLPTERPYTCPDPNVDLKAYPSADSPFISCHFWDTDLGRNVELRGHQYTSGHCLGTEHWSSFVYVDQEQGMFAINFTSWQTISLSSTPCPATGWYPWAVFEHRYLLIPEGEGIDSSANVVDCESGFSTIIKAQHVPTDMVTVAHLPTSSKVHPPTGVVEKEKDGFDPRWLATLSLPIIVVAAVSTFLATCYV